MVGFLGPRCFSRIAQNLFVSCLTVLRVHCSLCLAGAGEPPVCSLEEPEAGQEGSRGETYGPHEPARQPPCAGKSLTIPGTSQHHAVKKAVVDPSTLWRHRMIVVFTAQPGLRSTSSASSALRAAERAHVMAPFCYELDVQQVHVSLMLLMLTMILMLMGVFGVPPYQEALRVSKELIRVAILWHEQWHEGLEDASRL